jgi:NADP-dependent 3-hydroxy acid dehydrogenase YdfG
VRTESLQDRVAVVTGASSGIGAAVARVLNAGGAHVALAARREDALLEVRDGLTGHGKSIIAPTDVTSRDQVRSLVGRAEEELGPVEILVNCAGVMYYTLYVGHDLQEGARPLGEPHPLASEVRQGRYEK